MKKIFPSILVLALVAGLTHPSLAEENKTENGKILTAIDVAALMENGSSDVEIVKLLSEQRSIDKASPILKGKTEQQKIPILLNLPEPSKKDADKGKTAAYRTAGENFFKIGEYAKAARELSLATKYSANNLDIYNYELYKARGDSYKEFLKAKLSPSTPIGREEAKRQFFEQKRKLICGAVYSDYRTASALLDRTVRDGITELETRNVRMKELKEGKDPTRQYKTKSSEYINIMRDMRRLLYRQASAKSGAKHLKSALDDYRTVCSAEEQVRADLVRQARDKARDRKWVKFGEIDDASYFYNKAAVKKSNNSVTAWFRKETTDDEKSHDIVKVSLECGKKTFATQETSSYGEDGKLKSKHQFKKAVVKSVVKGGPEELLIGSICK